MKRHINRARRMTIDRMCKLWDRLLTEVAAAKVAADVKERCLDKHGYGCARAECGRSVPPKITGLMEIEARS